MAESGFARSKATVLIADNNAEWLRQQKEALASEGFEVLIADGPLRAEEALRSKDVDAMVCDIRLENDDDAMDISGLELAQRTRSTIGKVITTTFPVDMATGKEFKDTIGVEDPFVTYVEKKEGIQAIVAATKKVAAFSMISRNSDTLWDLIISHQTRTRYTRMLVPLVLLGALAAGVIAAVTGDANWLFLTVTMAVIAVVLIGRSTS